MSGLYLTPNEVAGVATDLESAADVIDTCHTKFGAIYSWQQEMDEALCNLWHDLKPTLDKHALDQRVKAAKTIAAIRKLMKASWKAASEAQAIIELHQEGASEINADLDDRSSWDGDTHRVHELLCQAGLR